MRDEQPSPTSPLPPHRSRNNALIKNIFFFSFISSDNRIITLSPRFCSFEKNANPAGAAARSDNTFQSIDPVYEVFDTCVHRAFGRKVGIGVRGGCEGGEDSLFLECEVWRYRDRHYGQVSFWMLEVYVR